MSGTLLVTGGGRGIGAAVARLGAAAGYAVCVNYRSNAVAAEAVVAEIDRAGGTALAVQADVARQLGMDNPISPTVGLDPAKYQEFALTDDSVIFFFGQGEIMAGAGGALQARVPRSAVASMLT